jgi:hypothetical protein
MHHAHAAPATAAGGLDDHRVAHRAADLDDFLGSSGSAPSEPGTQGTPAAFMASLALTLSPIRRMVSGRGPMKAKAGLFDAFAEVGIFREEAVAGVDRLGVGDFGRGNDGGDVQVALTRRRRADADRFVGQLDVFRLGVGLRVHGDGAHAEFAAGAQDAQRDFAAVCYENLAEHAQPITNMGCPYSTAWPFSTWMALITPEMSASISFISFIASITHSVSPALTVWPTSTKGEASGLLAR